MMSESSNLHRIIVVGGGAGGLELVTRLGDKLGRRKLADVTLIDRSRAHLWKPLLHEIAAGTMDFAVHEIDYLAQAHWHSFRYRIGEMIGLDRQRREVQLAAYVDEEGHEVTPRRSFRYDTLIIAVGSQSNDFGTPGVREHAISLDTPVQAKRFHGRLVNAYIRGHAQSQPLRAEQLQVAIIGAGATGTELAAELHYTTRQLVAYGLDRIDPEKDIQINLIEAADRILPALPERLSDAGLKLLKNLGVRVHTSSKVAEVSATGVKLASGSFIPAELVVWAAGVKAPDVLANLDGLESTGSNQLLVLQTLHGKPPQPWHYRDFGSLVSLGEYSTVGNLMGGLVGRNLWIEGLFARLMYRSLYKMHEYALHGPTKVTLDTLARLITRRTEPHVKLH